MSVEVAPDARREQRGDVASHTELTCRHGQELVRSDAEHLRELVLAIELGPSEVKQPEERLEHASAGHRARLEHRLSAAFRQRVDLFVGAHLVEVALIELNHDGELLDAQAKLFEILPEIEERRCVVLGLADLRVGYEDDAVSPLQDEPTGRRVKHLPGDRENLDPQSHAVSGALGLGSQRQGEHIEEERAVVLRFEGHQPPSRPLRGELVERA